MQHEFHLLKNHSSLPKASISRNLCPFYDSETDLVRVVSGRLGNTDFSELKKFPLLFPSKSFGIILEAQFHEATLHGGGQKTNAALREEFWIIGSKNLIKIIINCVKCSRYKGKVSDQIMAVLPKERVTPSRPFLHCGLDFAGPLTIKNQEIYIALFFVLQQKQYTWN